VAKVMILSGLVFGRQLRREQVAVRGITAITGREIAEARSAGGGVKHVATLGFAGPEGAGSVTASVQPELVRDGDSWRTSTAPPTPDRGWPGRES
jgi:homoserine dehydrogenase